MSYVEKRNKGLVDAGRRLHEAIKKEFKPEKVEWYSPQTTVLTYRCKKYTIVIRELS